MDVNGKVSLADKLTYLRKHDDCSSTNVEGVFNLVLDTAVKNNATQDDMPKSILLVTDCEFNFQLRSNSADETLFENIEKKYKDAGYELPRLIFWNVNSRDFKGNFVTNNIICRIIK